MDSAPSGGKRVEKKPSLWRKRLLKEEDETEVVPAIEQLVLLTADDRVFESEDILADAEENVIPSPYAHDSISESAKKYDSDANFSDCYLAIVRALKELQNKTPRPIVSLEALESELETKRAFYPKPIPRKVLKSFQRKLEKHDLDPSLLENKFQKVFSKERRRHPDNKGTNNMNSLWQMLATYNEFTVTKPDFNIYDEKCHWLDQRPLPWIIQENSRKKCAQWLTRNFE
ncbi:unnamed protein product [Bemisia tabaci]|uniref:Uncharacterized protein n=1 Tax=Bemisia tabaci TaxID=7038 RepID=A0A9P0EWL9_BEMTA|nr:unnamed protein product [Bemisia tabaci]